MLTSGVAERFQAKKRRGHALSMLMVFNPLICLMPITIRYPRFLDFGEDNMTVTYQDIYVFGFRVIRRQLY